MTAIRTDDDILLDIALHFGTAMDLASLLPVVLDRFAALTLAQRAAFALIDNGGQVQRAVVHNLPWDGDTRNLPVSHSVIEDVVRTRQRVVISDVADGDDYSARQSVRDLQLRLIVGIPVTTDGKVVGVLYADSQLGAGSGWSPRLDLLEAVTRLVGTAMTNARLFEEQRFRARLLAEMAHDLRSPITVVTANARFLAEGTYDPDIVMSTAGDIDISARHMVRIIDTSLELSRLDQVERPTTEGIRLHELLAELVRPWRVLAKRLGISLSLNLDESQPAVETVADTLRVVLENLISNAVKHATADSTVQVEMCAGDGLVPETAWSQPPSSLFGVRRFEPMVAAADTDWVHVKVTNHGDSIPEYLRQVLFNPFTGTKEERGTLKSTGLGLGIVAVCMTHLGGRVWVERSDISGTCLTICLPTHLDCVPERVDPVAANP